MMYKAVSMFTFAVALVSLTGCEQQNVRDGSGEGATGNLGSPLVRRSPADIYIELSAAYLKRTASTRRSRMPRRR